MFVVFNQRMHRSIAWIFPPVTGCLRFVLRADGLKNALTLMRKVHDGTIRDISFSAASSLVRVLAVLSAPPVTRCALSAPAKARDSFLALENGRPRCLWVSVFLRLCFVCTNCATSSFFFSQVLSTAADKWAKVTHLTSRQTVLNVQARRHLTLASLCFSPPSWYFGISVAVAVVERSPRVRSAALPVRLRGAPLPVAHTHSHTLLLPPPPPFPRPLLTRSLARSLLSIDRHAARSCRRPGGRAPGRGPARSSSSWGSTTAPCRPSTRGSLRAPLRPWRPGAAGGVRGALLRQLRLLPARRLTLQRVVITLGPQRRRR